MGRFATVDDECIKRGECTDVYFERSGEVLARSGLNPAVAMEVTAASLPGGAGILCGLDDVISLLEGLPVSLDAMPEGTLFYPFEPVLRITGRYRDFGRYETAVLGFLCHASGIATAAAAILTSDSRASDNSPTDPVTHHARSFIARTTIPATSDSTPYLDRSSTCAKAVEDAPTEGGGPWGPAPDDDAVTSPDPQAGG